MKRLGWIVVGMVLGVGGYFLLTGQGRELQVPDFTLPLQAGTQLPSLRVKTLEGKILNFPRGRDTLFVFWASWCEPCAQETPSLIALAKEKSQWDFVLLSQDSTQKDILQFKKIFPNLDQANVFIIWDSGHRMQKAFGSRGLPESFLFTKEGKFQKQFVGAMDWLQVFSSQSTE